MCAALQPILSAFKHRVEESEADLERFKKWLAAIMARDYFYAQPASRPEQLFNNAVTR